MSETVYSASPPDGESLFVTSEFATPHETTVCEAAIADLLRLGQELQIDHEKIERLATAIDTYARTVKPEPTADMDLIMEVGRCMTVPGNFRQFCNENVGLEVDTGAYISRSSGGSINFYHEVNVIDGIIIDWTAKQFSQDRDKPYPLVYENGGEEMRASWGPLGTRQI